MSNCGNQEEYKEVKKVQYTNKTNEILGNSVKKATTLGNPNVEPIHLLNALLENNEESIHINLLKNLGSDELSGRNGNASPSICSSQFPADEHIITAP